MASDSQFGGVPVQSATDSQFGGIPVEAPKKPHYVKNGLNAPPQPDTTWMQKFGTGAFHGLLQIAGEPGEPEGPLGIPAGGGLLAPLVHPWDTIKSIPNMAFGALTGDPETWGQIAAGAPFAAMGIPGLPEGLPRSAGVSAASALPDISTMGRFGIKMLPYGRTALRGYDALRDMMPSAGDEPPGPFRPNPAIAAKTRYGGPISAPRSGSNARTPAVRPSQRIPPIGEPPATDTQAGATVQPMPGNPPPGPGTLQGQFTSPPVEPSPPLTVNESPRWRNVREETNREIININPQAFKDTFEAIHREPLDWNAGRSDSLKSATSVDQYPFVGTDTGKSTGRIGVTDGRHRIAEAARRGQTSFPVQVEPGDQLPPNVLAPIHPTEGATNLTPLAPIDKFEMNRMAHARAQELNLPGSPAGKSGHPNLSAMAKKKFGVNSWADLSVDQMRQVYDELK